MPKGVYLRKALPLSDRFWPKVQKSPECWLWTGGRHLNGYGQFYAKGRGQLAHRISWEIAYGPVPDGLLVLHHCDNPPCVRPDHLFLGTPSDNAHDMVAKGRHWTVRGAERLTRGDAHWTRQHPERVPRGNASSSRRFPERLVRGEDHPSAKLTADDVREIRSLAAEGWLIKTLATAYEVGRPSIKRIIKRTGWTHII